MSTTPTMPRAPGPDAASPALEVAPARRTEGPAVAGRHPRVRDVLIVGAGLSGLAMALEARAAGRDVAVIEKADGPGGTWAANTYPGAACDVPSHLYQLAARPHTGWSRPYAPQPEILAYAERVAAELGKAIRYGAAMERAEWDGAAKRWQVTLATGETIVARRLVLATGMLHVPKRPGIEGLEEFAGAMHHTAEWPEAFDPRGKRIAVIGTGASAIQVVPPLAELAARLHLVQRTPPWVVAKKDRPFARRRRLFAALPPLARAYRAWLDQFHEMRHMVWRGHERAVEWAERMARETMEDAIDDPALRAALTPDYRIGCKRILQSSDYYPAIARGNVELVTAPVERIVPEGLIAGGRTIALDAIVLATGFHVAEGIGLDVRGPDGVTLRDLWTTRALAHCGTAVHGLPNCAMLLGPGTGLGHNSVVLMAEAQTRYLTRLWDAQDGAGWEAMTPRAAAQSAWRDELDAMLSRTVWGRSPGEGGCLSWYHDAKGRPTAVWPGTVRQFRRRLARSGLGDYEPV